MSGSVWHPTLDVYEVHGSRQENWNDVNPSASVVLEVQDAEELHTVVDYLIRNKPIWPFMVDSYVYGYAGAPFNIYATNVEVLPYNVQYNHDATTSFIVKTQPTQIRVQYVPLNERLVTITISAGVGSATAYGYRTQNVWMATQRIVTTEFLTLDYNNFTWTPVLDYSGTRVEKGGDPLKPEEAPGMPLRSIKYINTYRNIFLVEDLEDIFQNYSGTVNNSSLSRTEGGITVTYEEEQVLFNIEEAQPSMIAVVPTLDWFGAQQLYNLRCSFHCRKGLSTWNKFWRAKSGTAGSVQEGGGGDGSGWYEIYHKPTAGELPTQFLPYASTNYWYPLWV